MIDTVLMYYDGTLHDWDSVLHRALDGILGLSGEELFCTWTFEFPQGGLIYYLAPCIGV